ncbi:SGNH/GDSL hydrolase family protein [Phycisphaerales bacterium AB-hyl4]|uniref:SGNH/GDSL hydrolase family protein n=1 Tax=Natronomicrosphaera hydrolytica TaxID=3242702 RepID=A0ABV4U469_9BACT
MMIITKHQENPTLTSDSLPTLLVLGDSISLQYGPHLESYLADRCVYRTKQAEGDAFADLDLPQGKNVGDSRMLLAYLRALDEQNTLHADFILMNCGLHDIKVDPSTGQRQVDITAYRENLLSIVDLLQQRSIPLAWMRTTPVVDAVHNAKASFHRFAADNEAYIAVADDVMAQRQVPLIDLHSFTRSLGDDEQLFCDHVHYHAPIRQLQAAYLAGWFIAHTESMFPLRKP